MWTYSRAKQFVSVAGLAAVAWLPPSTVAAQDGTAVGSLLVEEVTVTARRRVESLQDVPLAISAVSGADLEQRGVQNVGSMNSIAPNFSAMGGGNSGESQANFRVRGIPGVAVYVDGVSQATTDGLLTMSVVEVDRIEVLRGPQGTLFGNAALGGAVHYVTKAPADKFGVRAQASVGSYNRRDFQAGIDLPFHDTFKVKLTGASQTRDGFVESLAIDRDYGDVNDELLRGDFLWTPTDSLSFRYNVETTNTNRDGPARVVWEIGEMNTFTGANGQLQSTYPQAQAYANAFGFLFNNQNFAADYPDGRLGKYQNRIAWKNPGLRIDQIRHTLDGSWELNDTFRVRSITGYKELERAVQVDFDGAQEVMILERDNRAKSYSFSEELQLLGSHQRVDWVLGAYYGQDHLRTRSVTWVMPEFTCDMWTGASAARVSTAERATCLANRRLALGAPANTPAAGLNAFNLNGVTISTFSSAASNNNDSMTLSTPKTQALFGDVTFRITDAFSIAAGLRYSEDENPGQYVIAGANLTSRASMLPDVDVPNWFGFNALPARGAATKYDALTKRLTLQYQWSPDVMMYVGYSDGYAPGATTNTQPSILTYMSRLPAGVSDVPASVVRDEQTIRNYEFGLRAEWFGGSLRTNVTAFMTDWENVEVSQYVATTYWDTDGDNFADSQVDLDGDGAPDVLYFPSLWSVGVAKAEAQGVEVEAVWIATDSLRFDVNFGWLDTKYKELGQAGLGAVPAVNLDTRFAQAPELTANVAASYDIRLANGVRVLPRLDYTYTGDYALNAGEALQRVQKGFGLLNARITYDAGTNWDVSLIGTNLTNEYYFNSGFFTRAEQIHFMTVGRPREWGMTLNVRFE